MEATMIRNKNKHKTKIDWDLNVYCPEQWYGGESFWDPELWKINARIYGDHTIIDTEYTLTLLPKEARAIGLVQFAEATQITNAPAGMVHDDWLDAGLDGFIDRFNFHQLYGNKMSNRLLEFLDTLPVYVEDVPSRMMW